MPFLLEPDFRIQISKYRIFELEFRNLRNFELEFRNLRNFELEFRNFRISNKNFEIIKLISKFWAEYYFEMFCFEILKFRNIDFEIIFFNFEIFFSKFLKP